MTRPGYYLGDHRILTITDRGDRMYLDTRDILITPGVLCWGNWEPETVKTFEQILRPGMKWADIGANVGYFSIIGHKMVRDDNGHTWAFEANPTTYSILQDNQHLNWLWSNMVCEQVAVYSETKLIEFYAPVKRNANSGIANRDIPLSMDNTDVHQVKAVSVDDYFFNNGIILDFIKIDVEGAEEYVLRGAEKLLTANRSIQLLIEWSPGQMPGVGSSPESLLTLIRSYGFEISVAEGERRPVSYEQVLEIQDTTMLHLVRA